MVEGSTVVGASVVTNIVGAYVVTGGNVGRGVGRIGTGLGLGTTTGGGVGKAVGRFAGGFV